MWDARTWQKSRLVHVAGGVDDIFWSSDSESIIYQPSQSPDLYAVARRGGKPKRLVDGRGKRWGYRFSPDGKQVAFIQDGALCLADCNGNNPSLILKTIQPDDQTCIIISPPQWSVSGEKLAISRVCRNKDATIFHSDLHVIDIVNKKDRVVATILMSAIILTWSRDNQWLIVKTHERAQEGLMAVSLTDGHTVVMKELKGATKGLDWFESR